jgi:hypothetical protein
MKKLLISLGLLSFMAIELNVHAKVQTTQPSVQKQAALVQQPAKSLAITADPVQKSCYLYSQAPCTADWQCCPMFAGGPSQCRQFSAYGITGYYCL